MRCASPTVWPSAVGSIVTSSPTRPTTTSPELSPSRTCRSTSCVSRNSSEYSPIAFVRCQAAWQARRAWSSSATGAPNSAMIPSPVNLSTVPPNLRTPSARIDTNRPMMAAHTSASRRSCRSIEPATSANRTVMCFFSPELATVASDAGASVVARALPHSMQNRALAGAAVPQDGQAAAREAPQWTQNLATAGFSVEQVGQALMTAVRPLAARRWPSRVLGPWRASGRGAPEPALYRPPRGR